jgi:chemotaxis family two-component system response regulator Rcp1
MATMTLNKTDPIQVLMAEDNMADVVLVQQVFKTSRWPVQMSLAIDGEEAIDCLRGEGFFTAPYRPDIIFLDLSMPKKSGWEVLCEIRADSGYDNIPIIVLTNSKSEADMNQVYALGADFYLVKPRDLDELYAAIEHVENEWFTELRPPA